MHQKESSPDLQGLVPGFCGVIHGSLQFMAYEELKQLSNRYCGRPHNCRLSTHEYLACAAVSKMFAAVLTYPHQVVRARLQDQYKSYAGLADVVRTTFREEGLRGFYKGLAPNLMHVTPNICLVFIIYEKLTESSDASR
jgi:solute carrier family 25 folate transporter 32